MNSRELDRPAFLLQFISQARVSFLAQFGNEFVAPRYDEPPRRVDLQNFAAVANPPVGNHKPPGCSGLPFGLVPAFVPVSTGEFGIGQGLPQFLRRRADVGYIGESRIGHRNLLPRSSQSCPRLVRRTA